MVVSAALNCYCYIQSSGAGWTGTASLKEQALHLALQLDHIGWVLFKVFHMNDTALAFIYFSALFHRG